MGRGLGSLLGENSLGTLKESQRTADFATDLIGPKSEVQSEMRIWNIGIEKIIPSKFQPRTHMEKDGLDELASSIKEHGIIQPITVAKRNNGSFEIIAGERRWRAAQLAGLHEVPVIIKNIENKEHLEWAIIENIQRENLNPLEEGLAYHRLSDEFQLTQQQIAQKVGKDRTTIANLMRLIMLPEALKEQVKQNILSLGHAKVLLSLESAEDQIKFAAKCVKDGTSVRGLEKLIAQWKSEKEGLKENLSQGSSQGSRGETVEKDKILLHFEDQLMKALGTKVQITEDQGRGKVVMSFYSKDELNHIVDRIVIGCLK